MVKYREILRLEALGVSRRNIGFSVGCSPNTVQSVSNRAKAAGISWPLPEEMNDAALKAALFPPKAKQDADKHPIDHGHVEREMARRGMTMTLLWNEYCDSATSAGKEPYMYSAFCHRHRRWAAANKVSMHIDRKPAEQIQVDWVGDTMEVVDPDTGELLKVYVFVACLPYSGYVYAEGFYDMRAESWISAHVNAFGFFGGSTPILVPDNLKTGIVKNTVAELVVNDQYRLMAEHYGTAVVPARPRKPRDKGAVEMSVGVVERRAIAALRDRRFMSLGDLNRALLGRVRAINSAPFQKRDGSRESVFLGQERALLIPLPAQPYAMTTRKTATVNSNYHVDFDGAWYSVPFTYASRVVEVVATKDAVAVVADGQRIAMHQRVREGQSPWSTKPSHMPENHREFLAWNGERFRSEAAKVGPSCSEVMASILASHRVEQQAYRSCKGLISLARTHGRETLEQACAKALSYTKSPSYKTVKSVIPTIIRDDDPDDGAYLRGDGFYDDYLKTEEGFGND